MQLTQKETMLLQDLKSQEQLCVDKYAQYAERACDSGLKALFTSIGQCERGHMDTVSSMLGGTVPMMTGGGSQDNSAQPSSCDEEEKKRDNYLCADALATEKHVSSAYNTAIFEFTDTQARDALNRIQKEEQEHGKRIYDYMSVNGMNA